MCRGGSSGEVLPGVVVGGRDTTRTNLVCAEVSASGRPRGEWSGGPLVVPFAGGRWRTEAGSATTRTNLVRGSEWAAGERASG